MISGFFFGAGKSYKVNTINTKGNLNDLICKGMEKGRFSSRALKDCLERATNAEVKLKPEEIECYGKIMLDLLNEQNSKKLAKKSAVIGKIIKASSTNCGTQDSECFFNKNGWNYSPPGGILQSNASKKTPEITGSENHIISTEGENPTLDKLQEKNTGKFATASPLEDPEYYEADPVYATIEELNCLVRVAQVTAGYNPLCIPGFNSAYGSGEKGDISSFKKNLNNGLGGIGRFEIGGAIYTIPEKVKNIEKGLQHLENAEERVNALQENGLVSKYKKGPETIRNISGAIEAQKNTLLSTKNFKSTLYEGIKGREAHFGTLKNQQLKASDKIESSRSEIGSLIFDIDKIKRKTTSAKKGNYKDALQKDIINLREISLSLKESLKACVKEQDLLEQRI